MLEIKFADENDQVVEADLDGKVFEIRLSWNESGQYFTLELSSETGLILIGGVSLVSGVPLLWRYRDATLPDGDFMLVTNDGFEVNRKSFILGQARLFYITKDELSEAGLASIYGLI